MKEGSCTTPGQAKYSSERKLYHQPFPDLPSLVLEVCFDLMDHEIGMAKKLEDARRRGAPLEEFDVRSGPYNLALRFGGGARDLELQRAMEWIDVQQGERCMDVASGTGFLTMPLAHETMSTVYAVDPSKKQLEWLDKNKAQDSEVSDKIVPIVGSLDRPDFFRKLRAREIDLEGRLDVGASLGGVHHSWNHRMMFRNFSLASVVGGRFAIIDVGTDTSTKLWFDEVVSRHSITGHSGNWCSPENIEKDIEGLPLKLVKTDVVDTPWSFKSELFMYLYDIGLHAHDRQEHKFADYLDDVRRTVGYEVASDGVKKGWQLRRFLIERTKGRVPRQERAG